MEIDLNAVPKAVPDAPETVEVVDGREINIYLTPLGKKVSIKSYLTARERRKIRAAYSSNVKTVTDADGNAKFEVMDGRDIVSVSEDCLLEQAVVSYDGSSENIVERLLNAHSSEHKFILGICNDIGKDPK